jgi:hypothetical protein
MRIYLNLNLGRFVHKSPSIFISNLVSMIIEISLATLNILIFVIEEIKIKLYDVLSSFLNISIYVAKFSEIRAMKLNQ